MYLCVLFIMIYFISMNLTRLKEIICVNKIVECGTIEFDFIELSRILSYRKKAERKAGKARK